MTTISTLGLQQSLLAGFERAQSGTEVTQAQLASGNRVNDYAGLGTDAVALVNAEGVVARLTAFQQNAEIALSRFERQALNLGAIREQITGLRDNVLSALTANEASFLGEQLGNTVEAVTSALNDRLNGQFIFGGVRDDVPPVLLPQGADDRVIFAATQETSIRLDENLTVSGGPTAQGIAGDLFDTLGVLGALLAGNSDGVAGLAPTLRDGLVTLTGQLDEVLTGLATAEGQAGRLLVQAQNAQAQNELTRDLAELVANDIEDVDVAEALSRLSQDQIAVQAAAQALTIATQTSILNFI